MQLSILVGLVFFRIHKPISIGKNRERKCTLSLGLRGERLIVSRPFLEQMGSVISKDTALSPF